MLVLFVQFQLLFTGRILSAFMFGLGIGPQSNLDVIPVVSHYCLLLIAAGVVAVIFLDF